MSAASDQRSSEFLKLSGQFKLGALVTEASHPVTADLSEVAARDIAGALDLLFQVDGDVVSKFREFAASGRAEEMANAVVQALTNGGRIFFTGCGSTGRLSILLVSIWRDFLQRQPDTAVRANSRQPAASLREFEHRAFSVMAGGDYALIKSVEGFEDFAAFGRKQLQDLGANNRDIVFAITEGGETSFVIGTAWQGLEAGARTYFIYNNPDEILSAHVERSRQILEEPHITKVNLTTGPMAITGSTRMQATSIQLCVMLTVLEMAVRGLKDGCDRDCDPAAVPGEFLAGLAELHATLRSARLRNALAQLVAVEESVYRAGGRNNYYANALAIDVLTDTTERSPTFCTPPFRKWDDPNAAESWAFLFLPNETPDAWRSLLKRPPHCIAWSESEIAELVPDELFTRTREIVGRISVHELMRFRIGCDGLPGREPRAEDSAIAVVSHSEAESLDAPESFYRGQLNIARARGARTGILSFGNVPSTPPAADAALSGTMQVHIPVATSSLLLDGVTRVAVKLVLNALSTCIMVRLGRVMGNCMIWVVPSNLKLIDRATRYVQRLAGLPYEAANRLVFEVIEYVEPRMKNDRAYPPVVGMAVLRAREQLTNEQAEQRLLAGSALSPTRPEKKSLGVGRG